MTDDTTALAEAVGVYEPDSEHWASKLAKGVLFTFTGWLLLSMTFLMAPMTPGSYPYA